MIGVDTSVAMKWFKPGERYEAEALDFRQRIHRSEVESVASELLGLEIVRGLKNTQSRQPALGITDAAIDRAFASLGHMVQGGEMLECSVTDVRERSKEIILTLGLFTADAVHLATAVYMDTQYFVTDDRHFFAADVVRYATSFGVRVVNLPDLIAALNAARGPGAPPP